MSDTPSQKSGQISTEITRPPVDAETFDGLRQRIRDRFSTLSPHLQRIARSSLEEPNSFALNTTAKIAADLDIQPSTLIRFAKEFGYSGFSDLQRVFRQRLIEGEPTVRERVYSEETARPEPPNVRELLQTCVAAHVAALNDLVKTCDTDSLARAVEMLRGARHVYIAGLRRSRPIAAYLAYALTRSERASSLLDFAGGMAGPQIATIGPDDVLVAIAFPPYSRPVVDIVLDAYVSGRKVLAITDGPGSPLASNSQLQLYVDAGAASAFQPISGAIGLVQTVITALNWSKAG
ncbi:MurR/RpiR family transcriptional regulator [Ferrovibrio terrae]|uniref:MurR/RpiR family transcriptional regulator n=1 Tax=Ferrovibrio terrae TaxID=2594003 RepID=A0A516H6U7_9PROT|nr:MurR/RpiR family transcriptional regulator [Ferrovibrio terrae]QDO99451.1 MurR/RpiR family transcriptional regulator [Ferrovibrio terrae]